MPKSQPPRKSSPSPQAPDPAAESCATITLSDLVPQADVYTGGDLSLPEPEDFDPLADSFAFDRSAIDLGGQVDPNQPLDAQLSAARARAPRRIGMLAESSAQARRGKR